MSETPSKVFWPRALSVWLLLTVAEFAHGILRASLLAPRVGDLRSRRLGVGTGALIIFAITVLTVRWMGARRPRALLAIGGVWLALTTVVEIGLGRVLLRYSWDRASADVAVRRGGLLLLGLAVLALAPLLAARLRGVSERGAP